jgi:uncharacterized membrane protein YccC
MTPSRLQRFFGHQRPHLVAALRGTAAALTALAAAELLGLACPYWAAMTALIVIQPTRGLLFEKSFYRLIGTVVGSSAGLLLLLYTRSPMLITLALCLWMALCVGVGNLLYGLRSYASLMAGCTCAVIAMSGYQNPPHLYDIAFGRVACIIVGIIFATLVTALFTPRQSRAELMDRLDRVTADAVAWLALLLRQGRGNDLPRLEHDLLTEIAGIESLLDAAGAGSLRFKKHTRQIRSVLTALLSLLAVGRLAGAQLALHNELDRRHGRWRDQLASHLEELAGNLERPAPGHQAAGLTAVAAEAKSQLPLLGETLDDIVSSLRLVLEQCATLGDTPEERPVHRFQRHRDWRQACRAAIRAVLAIAAVGVTWSVSGWAQGPLMLMATSIMISIFSTKEHPAAFVGNIFLGAALGSALAVFCRVVLLQGVTSPLLTGVIVAPFLLVGVFAMTQRKTATGATDATFFFIFTTQPGVPVAVVPHDLVLGAIAMVMGVVSAWLAYRYLIPVNPALRLRSLLRAIMGDLESLASAGCRNSTGVVLARMQHRVVRLVVLATQYDAEYHTVVEGGLAALATAKTIQRLKEALELGGVSAERSGFLRDALLSLSQLRRRPGNPVQLLEYAANTLYEIRGSGFTSGTASEGKC